MLKPTNLGALIETLSEVASGRITGPDSGCFRHALAADAFNYFLSKIVPGLMGFLSVLVFVRMVGVETYGRYAVVFAFVMAWASGLAGWLGQGILRFQSQWNEPGNSANFLRSAGAGTVLSVATGVLAVGVALPAFAVQKGWPMLISLELTGGLIVYTVVIARFQAALQSAMVLRFEVVRSVGCFLIPVALLWVAHSRDYRLLLLGISLGYWLPLLGMLFSRTKTGAEPEHRRGSRLSIGQRQILGELWQYGWPVALWMLCQQGLLVSDRYFLQRYSGYSEAGVYASMYDVIVRSFSLLLMPVTLAVHPFIMNRWNAGNRKHALQAIRAGVRYQFLMFVPIGIAMAVFAPWISRLVLGKPNAGAEGIVLPLAAGGLLWQVCLLAHKPLEVLCQTKRMLVGIAASLAVNVAGNWLLVPTYGYRASAYLMVASASAYLILLSVLTPGREFRDAVEGAAPRSGAEVTASSRVDFLETSS